MNGMTTCLWFDTQAEEAANFYASIFKDAKIGKIVRYPEGAEIEKTTGKPAGSVMTVEFELRGQKFLGLNGGPIFKLNEAVSFIIDCEDQAEIDYYWDKLGEGGPVESKQCGWLKDKFGLSWQVVPKNMPEIMGGDNPEKNARTMKVLMPMKKLVIAELIAARDGA